MSIAKTPSGSGAPESRARPSANRNIRSHFPAALHTHTTRTLLRRATLGATGCYRDVAWRWRASRAGETTRDRRPHLRHPRCCRAPRGLWVGRGARRRRAAARAVEERSEERLQRGVGGAGAGWAAPLPCVDGGAGIDCGDKRVAELVALARRVRGRRRRGAAAASAAWRRCSLFFLSRAPVRWAPRESASSAGQRVRHPPATPTSEGACVCRACVVRVSCVRRTCAARLARAAARASGSAEEEQHPPDETDALARPAAPTPPPAVGAASTRPQACPPAVGAASTCRERAAGLPPLPPGRPGRD